VAQQLLDRADVLPRLEQVRGEGVAQRVAGGRLAIPALYFAVFTARCRTASSTWWRRVLPLRGSFDSDAAENRYCQDNSRPALGNFRSRACGSQTPTSPAALSCEWITRTRDTDSCNASRRRLGNGTRRSLPPLPLRTMIS